MIERIRRLEAVARRLDPDAHARERAREHVARYSEEFLEHIHDVRAYDDRKELAHELRAFPISDEPADIEELLPLLKRAVDTAGINPASGGHLGYIPGGGLYYSALGDFLADVTNRYAGVAFAGPGAVEMENMLLDWMAELVGYPEGSGGNLASGGSIANLIAIVTAREAHELGAKDFERSVVYQSQQVHHCVDKALRVAGMGECIRRNVPLDSCYRMRPNELERAVAEDRKQGLVPWMVIASAGTTDVGAIDPLAEIGRIARSEGLWYHIDGAYGGFFALCEEVRPKLAGMELSDSIVLDPHKGLFLPYGTGAVLIKDRAAMQRAHHYHANYMQDVAKEEAGTSESPADLSPELSKHFRGLRLWLPLKLHGVAPFRACLEEKLALTRYFYERVQELGFRVGPEPELSVATYWYEPEEKDANAFNQALMERLHRDGRVFLSSTRLGDRFVLRLAALAFRTHLETIELTLEMLDEHVGALLKDGAQA